MSADDTDERLLAALTIDTRPKAKVADPEAAKRRATARSRAGNKAREALARLYPDEYRRLYELAFEQQLTVLEKEVQS